MASSASLSTPFIIFPLPQGSASSYNTASTGDFQSCYGAPVVPKQPSRKRKRSEFCAAVDGQGVCIIDVSAAIWDNADAITSRSLVLTGSLSIGSSGQGSF